MPVQLAPASATITGALRRGCVIPAHALALDGRLGLDERHQRALTRYYLDAGAGGLAVGVHTTEFAIHRPDVGLYKPVLELAAETARKWKAAPADLVLVAGIVGRTGQAVREAQTARALGYHVGLLSLGAMGDSSDAELLAHCRAVAEVLPVMGFYLQPSVGGRQLSEAFWRELGGLSNLVAVKIAPFNRYMTLHVVRALAEAGRTDVALYTGNDDSILVDLLTDWEIVVNGRPVRQRIVGGLLGHWAYWTRRAVEQLERCWEARERGTVPAELLTLAAQVTESNEAVFDPVHEFRGCISGILYCLARVGLIEAVRTLGEHERLSPGQTERIDAIAERYPHLVDDEFVRANLDRWLA
jgi:hypothetical protein